MEVMWSNIQRGIQTAANNIIGRVCKKPKDKWISEEVLDLVKIKRTALSTVWTLVEFCCSE